MANEIRYQRFAHTYTATPSGTIAVFTYSTANAEAVIKSVFFQLDSGTLTGWLRLNGHRIRWCALGPSPYVSNTTEHAFEVSLRGSVSDALSFEVFSSSGPGGLRILVSGVERLDLPAPSSTVEAYRHFREVGTLTPSVTSFTLFTVADPGLGIRRLVKWFDVTLQGTSALVEGTIRVNGLPFGTIHLHAGAAVGGSDLRSPSPLLASTDMETHPWEGRVLVLHEDDVVSLDLLMVTGTSLSMGWVFSGVDRENQV